MLFDIKVRGSYQTCGRMKRAGSKRTYNGERDEVAGDGEGADLTLVASLVTAPQTSGGKG